MKRKCCRSCPRCADCPARLLVAARRKRELDATAALVNEIFGGRPARGLPPTVAVAIEELQVGPRGPARLAAAEAAIE